MKKIVVLGTALLALNALASEVQVKAGFDLNRKDKQFEADKDLTYKKGPVAGLEYIFDNQGEFEWGIGAEYKMSRRSGSLLLDKVPNTVIVKENEDDEEEEGYELVLGTRKAEGKQRALKTAPVYVVGKFNILTTKKGNDTLYALGRVGYGFVGLSKDDRDSQVPVRGGLYGAIGLGSEFGPLSIEALYEKQNYSQKQVYVYDAVNDELYDSPKARHSMETFGVRLGYRFGKLVNDRQPKIVERVVEKVVTRTVEVPSKPAPAPAVKKIVTNNVTLPFSCAADEKVCVIRGFKVDGREPNEQEAADLRAIANIVNQFAEGGTIDFVGHTDSTGSDAYNQKLSVVRAQNVARLLKEYGLSNNVSYGKITGKGESKPADTNGTVQGRYNNRRVELYFDNVDFTNVNFVK